MAPANTFDLIGIVESPGDFSFVIPIFKRTGSQKELFFQVISGRNKNMIESFVEIDPLYYLPTNIKYFDRDDRFRNLSAGNEPIFVFQVKDKVSPNRNFITGNRIEMYKALTYLIDRNFITDKYVLEDIRETFSDLININSKGPVLVNELYFGKEYLVLSAQVQEINIINQNIVRNRDKDGA
jgi:hypothetical protein